MYNHILTVLFEWLVRKHIKCLLMCLVKLLILVYLIQLFNYVFCDLSLLVLLYYFLFYGIFFFYRDTFGFSTTKSWMRVFLKAKLEANGWKEWFDLQEGGEEHTWYQLLEWSFFAVLLPSDPINALTSLTGSNPFFPSWR